MRLYTPLLRYWLNRWRVPEAEFEDLLQEIWVALGPKLGGYRPGPGRSFRRWMCGVARHKTLDWHRRRAMKPDVAAGGSVALQRLGQVAEPIDLDDAEDSGEREEKRKLYARAIAELRGEFTDNTWRAFVGVAIESRTAADVGVELGLSSSAVRMAKSRVLRRVRQELGELIG